MASSQSIKRGQAPATCDLCEKETKIKWKCLSCNILMCSKCKDKIHVKFKLAKDHNVIDIKEVGINRGELDFSVLKCEKHSRQSCLMFCSSCDTLVCALCIGNTHNGHVLVEISRGFDIRKEKFKSDQNKIKEKIQNLMERKNEMTNVNMKNSEIYKNVIKRIEVQNVEVKNAADRYTDQLKSELNKKWSDLQTEEIDKLEKVIIDLQGLVSPNVEDIVLSNDVEKIFIDSSKLSNALNLAETNIGSISFLPGQISPMGSLQVVSNAVNVRIVKQFQTDISKVAYLSLYPDNSLWISDGDVLQKVKPVDHELIVESTFNIKVYGMSVTPTGDLLLSIDGSVLKQISGTTGKFTDSIFNVSPLVYTTVHVTKDGKVMVGVTSREKAFPVTRRRAIIVMNQKGEHETIYEHDKNNIRIFTHVKSITSTDNENICVVDMLSEDHRGRVVVLNRNGDILQIYTGHKEVNNEDTPFKPMRIVTTPPDNIIVTVSNIEDIFHILNNCGHLITHCNMGNIVISYPFSLCYTKKERQLYIGCTIEIGSQEKAKLYEVNISGY